MDSHSEGGLITYMGGDGSANFYTTRETLSCGVVRTTRRKEMKTGWRVSWGIVTLGISEIAGGCSDYITYTYSYDGRELGGSENSAADKAYEIGCDYLNQGKYEAAKQWLDIAFQTCKSGYGRESLFSDTRDKAIERMEEQQREEAKRKKDEEEKQVEKKKIERKEQRQRSVMQWRKLKTKAACHEHVRKQCEDRALHRRDKHTVLFCSAEVYQKQSQMEVNDILDSVQFTEVHENSEAQCEDVNMEEEDVSEIVGEEIERTELENIDEIDSQVKHLLNLVRENTSKGISSFQEQVFYMTIYRILDSVDSNEIDLVRLLEAVCKIVQVNKMSVDNFFSVATLAKTDSRLQKLICNFSEHSNFMDELKSTWLHQMLKMKNIDHVDSDLKKFLNVSIKFDFNFFVIATQKLLRFYTKFVDLLDFFVKIQKCPLTNESKQHFIHALTAGSSPLHLLAESVIQSYFCRKFSNFQSQQNRVYQTIEVEQSALTNFKAVVLDPKSESQYVFELATIMCKQFTDHWNFSHVDQLLGFVDTGKKIQPMVKCLQYVYDFEGSPLLLPIGELHGILSKSDARKWRNEVHEVLVERSFPEEKYLIKDELQKLNVFEHLKQFDFDRLLEYLKSAKSSVLPKNPVIDKLSKDEIKSWSERVRFDGSNSKVNFYEIIAVVNRAVNLHSKHSPRDVQNMALLLLLDSMESNTGGRLIQVNTGEGKTLIVAMFAAIMTLRGHVTDVITSSPELAKPQCEKMSSFYDYFGLTAAYVTPDCANTVRKDAYQADIVYGSAEEFQGDILRDEYSQLGTRCGRKFDIAIVDEVDSMLIDGRNHLVMLSSPVPGMENLGTVLATIWNHISMIEIHLIEKHGRVYLIDGCNRINEDGTLKPDEECIDSASPIEQTKIDFIKEQTEHFMRLLLRDETLDEESKEISKNYPEMFVPYHLRQFVLNVQLPKWIESAIFAKYGYKNNQHYIIKNGNIAPVDASNTGIVQANMHISNGIHQFLQIKHGAKLSPETYTTNYISNVAFFKRYGQRLVGLTGTLGSECAQTLLKKMYNVDTVILPPFKRKQYRQLRPLFAETKDEWLVTIAQSCVRQLEIGRAVLVIAQYLSEVDMLQNSLIKHGVKESKIHPYKTNENSDVIERELKAGEIIIATNIAGRGTDISVSKDVEKHGGLHVCLTSLPINERVEVQNFGRTSRTGNRGTGQFVVLKGVDSSLEELKRIRDEIERNRLHEAEPEIQKVLVKDKIFVEFCSLLKLTREKFRTKERLECETNARAVEERFGLWLKEHEDKIENEKDFQPFCELIRQELESDKFIRNPYFHVLKGNLMMDQKQFDSAVKEYTRAIHLDDRFLSNAYYNRGYCKIILYSKSQKKELASETVQDFSKAKEIIEGRLERDLFVIQQSAPASEALSEQVNHMMTLYGMQKSAIECAIGRGKGFVLKEIERMNNNEGSADETEQYIKHLKDNKVRYEEGVIGEALLNEISFDVTLKSLESSLPAEEKLSLYENELDTFRNSGNLGSVELKLIKPIEWGSVIGLALIGIGQIVTGAAIGVFSVGAGASIGFGMLIEGVTDLITAVVDGMINRDFSWAAWGIQKAVSFSVTIACAGLSALKNAAKVAYQGVKQTASAVTKGLTTTVKAGWRLAAKKMGLELGKGVARKLITGIADYSLNCTLMPIVEKMIKDSIRQPVKTMVDNNKDVAVLLEVDRTNRNAFYQQQLIHISTEILNPSSASSNIAMGLVRGLQQIGENVASKKIEGMSEAITLLKIQSALSELLKLFPKFVDALNSEIASMVKKYREMEEMSQKNKASKPAVVEEQVKLNSIDTAHGELTEQLTQAVATSMCNSIKGSLISPLLTYAVYEGVNSLTAEVNRNLNESLEAYKSQRRLIMLQDGDQHGMIDAKYKQGIRNPVAAVKAQQVIANVVNGEQAGLPLLGSVSDTINRPVTVLDSNGNVMMYIGEDKTGEPVYVQYREPTEHRPGHWTGPNNTEPTTLGKSSNNCLFDTVAEQVEMDPDQLRNSVCETLKGDKHLNLLANGARDIDHLQQSKEKYLLYGGYIEYKPGSGKNCAKQIIQDSQGKRSQGKGEKEHRSKNHPHGHVVGNPSTRRLGEDCVENYSFDIVDPRYAKTAVMSKDVQAELTDYVLSSDAGQKAIKRMNDPSTPEDERLEQKIRIEIPSWLRNKMVKWDKTGEIDSRTLNEYEVRIRRPLEEKYNPDKPYRPDVFTAFPISNTETTRRIIPTTKNDKATKYDL